MATNQNFGTRDSEIMDTFSEIRSMISRPLQLGLAECEEYVDQLWLERRNNIKELIPEMYKSSNFSDFESDLILHVKNVLTDIFSTPKGDRTDRIGLIIHGQVGSGKTRLAYAIANNLIEKNPEMVLRMDNFSVLMKKLKKEIFSKNADEDDFSLWEVITNESKRHKGILFLDDLSSKNTTDFESDTLLQLIDARINNYYPMIITTNLDKSELETVFGERIASRLIGNFHFIELSGLDNRVS